jgi:leucine dehydrogenase
MSQEGFEEVHALHDRRSGLRAYLAIHDASAGPAFGGVRRHRYAGESQALGDCLRLARNMSHKCALAELPAGGAKLVVLDDPELDLERAYRFLGQAVERLDGRVYTGPDAGTGERELDWLSQHTRFAAPPGPEGPGRLAESTAAGVFAGIRAALEHLDGSGDVASKRVVVQGLGSVGALLAERLVTAGASVIATDLDAERASEVARRLEIETCEPGHELGLECDVFSPNGMGGGLHDLSLPRLRARVVCGGANNVLSRTLHADALYDRGLLYVPDFAVNSGALIRGALFHLEGRRVPVLEIEERIHGLASELLSRAAEQDEPPLRLALVEARSRLEARRALRDSGELRPVSHPRPASVTQEPASLAGRRDPARGADRELPTS